MSLWTPGGEHEVPREPAATDTEPPNAPGAGGARLDTEALNLDDLSPEEREQAEQMIRQMAEAQQRIVEAPVEAVVANHLAGFYELAAIHLQQQPPNLTEAQVAIDAMAAVLDKLQGRLGEVEADLHNMLNNLQMAFVDIKAQAAG
jgi:hypothetical protein